MAMAISTPGVSGSSHRSPTRAPPTSGEVRGFVCAPGDGRRECEILQGRGVKIVQGPEEVPWGIQADFEDLYGNTHVLVEQREFGG